MGEKVEAQTIQSPSFEKSPDKDSILGLPSITQDHPDHEGKIFISPRARKLLSGKNINPVLIPPTGYGGIRIVERDVLNYLAKQPKITPVAQNIAAEAGLDVAEIQGSGVRGMVTKADIAMAIEKRDSSQTDRLLKAHEKEAGSSPSNEITNRIPLKGVKGIIFDRMGTSVHTTARVTLLMEVDATELVQIREKLKNTVAEDWGFAPGYNDLLGMMVSKALREYPFMNARISEDGQSIEWLKNINLGLAVDTDRGLIVPVIKDADQKGLRSFGSEFRAMVERARNGRSLPDDIQGGTFTITNLGMYDIEGFTPVINLPEAAILGVGRIAPKFIPINNQPTVRQMMTLSLVFDHRLIDGAPAARFLQKIKQYIESPYLLLG
jgi:pyruvate dehydrogenase E2 component (dihydrolipoamide acetyltransferase)